MPMNTIRLALGRAASHPPDTGVGIWVDGESLIDRFRRLEAPWWAEVGSPQPGEQYVWVPARIALLPSRHLLGEPAVSWCGEYSPVVVCNCGEYACRSYAVKIEVSSDRVGWTAWAEFPPEEARLREPLGPLSFDRAQYEAELTRVASEYRSVSPG
jgi:hypothetical protein